LGIPKQLVGTDKPGQGILGIQVLCDAVVHAIKTEESCEMVYHRGQFSPYCHWVVWVLGDQNRGMAFDVDIYRLPLGSSQPSHSCN